MAYVKSKMITKCMEFQKAKDILEKDAKFILKELITKFYQK